MENNNQQKTKKRFFRGATTSAIIISSVAVGLMGGGLLSQNNQKVYSEETTAVAQSLTDFEGAIIGAVEKTGDAVVSINNLRSNQLNSPFISFGEYSNGEGNVDLQDPEASLEVAGSGSGVVYKIDGDVAYIVTNNHVVEGAEKLQVVTTGGEKVDAELVGADVFSDLAVLKIDSTHVKTTIEFANSDELKVGSIAIAIGSPLGSEFSSSVTQGIVSGINRTIPYDLDNDGKSDWEMTLIQTDAAINPGNSGGALINKEGKLIGINSSKFRATEIEGMGFAIPSNLAKNIIDQLETEGKVIRPVIGIASKVYSISELSERSKVEILKLPEEIKEGIVITQVTTGGPAEEAGIETYDVITAIDDVPINDIMTLRQELYKHKVGDVVQLSIVREGEKMTIPVTLAAAE